MRRHRTIGNDLDRSLDFFFPLFFFFRCCQLSLCSPGGVAYFKTRRAKKSVCDYSTRSDAAFHELVAAYSYAATCERAMMNPEDAGNPQPGWIVRLFLGFPIALHIRVPSTVESSRRHFFFANFFFLFSLHISVVR